MNVRNYARRTTLYGRKTIRDCRKREARTIFACNFVKLCVTFIACRFSPDDNQHKSTLARVSMLTQEELSLSSTVGISLFESDDHSRRSKAPRVKNGALTCCNNPTITRIRWYTIALSAYKSGVSNLVRSLHLFRDHKERSDAFFFSGRKKNKDV